LREMADLFLVCCVPGSPCLLMMVTMPVWARILHFATAVKAKQGPRGLHWPSKLERVLEDTKGFLFAEMSGLIFFCDCLQGFVFVKSQGVPGNWHHRLGLCIHRRMRLFYSSSSSSETSSMIE